VSSGGRGRLPVWVVKIRSSLHRIAPSDLIRITGPSLHKPDCFRFGLSWQQV
jgi:hypothetical protein